MLLAWGKGEKNAGQEHRRVDDRESHRVQRCRPQLSKSIRRRPAVRRRSALDPAGAGWRQVRPAVQPGAARNTTAEHHQASTRRQPAGQTNAADGKSDPLVAGPSASTSPFLFARIASRVHVSAASSSTVPAMKCETQIRWVKKGRKSRRCGMITGSETRMAAAT